MSIDSVAPSQKELQVPVDVLLHMYELMWTIRHMDRRAVALQRQGRLGTYAPLEGQEAAQVGSALALRPQDFIFPSYREHGVAYIHGMPLKRILLYWNGRYDGCIPPDGVNLFPVSVPIATQIPHATGAALAAKLRKVDQIAVSYFGDGATSEGDFHEAMNFASVAELPMVFFCQNNGYAISVPLRKQMKVQQIAQKAAAYGMEGVTVDGNDVVEVYLAMRAAVEKAARGDGPTLVEAVTYRIGSHTTADDASRYREASEVEMWKGRDPIARLEKLLNEHKLLTDAVAHDIQKRAEQVVADAMAEMQSEPPATLDQLFDHVYQDMPQELAMQKKAAVLRQTKGVDGRG
ncbi:MAG: pyruvate dehydrogenase (acetyl-transferring) E1 component subunit alpha [Acidibacillus sp.]|uniref:Pyruvate dehydrogenase E1 component subunit alpha n=1 Tax=Sulfoacidibacillus ferrooxidans TaxID=2005001 RepID=A0A9X1V797_9BACL|nr:pyruvate dehydrogenase (acetyl-transferring) E1 component subunit alpha [Sulfoacidibacillus ferrooxidans]MCI0182568.1 3-methyl-2-oxobutanoate dehydrogenase subunit alpha [Sulfoacidibacillus ferrooxidans]MCY0894159.1 pyruvate dehydrogenase (acetyl-transferring) E1 component subunit alpha [Acidibacillus sp.]